MSLRILIKSPEKQRLVSPSPGSTSVRPFQGKLLSPILQLQRLFGNRRVAQLIQARRLTPVGEMIGLQPKITVGAADDQYELEANRVARQVTSMPDAVAANSLHRDISPGEGNGKMLQTKPLAASVTPFVQCQVENNEESEDIETPVQAKFLTETYGGIMQRPSALEEGETKSILAKSSASMSGSFEAGDDIQSQVSKSKGLGSPLPDFVSAYMEPRFGMDFSHVRAHTGSDALQINEALDSQAFTHSSDIYYGAGSSPTNLELTAHELVHVIQQTGNLPLQTKKWEEEAAPPDPEAFIQRSCLTCAADDGEEKKAYSIPRAETPVVRRLLGYGLGHVIQLSGRPRAGEGPPDLHATEPSIQRSVRTMGGSWDTIKYDLVRKEGDRDVTGLDISLKFIPEDPVDAELIGLTQTVRPIRKGNPRFVEDSSKRRATRAGEQGIEKGVHIDQPQTANPLYATTETGPTDTLASTPIAPPGISVTGEVRELGQHGWHYRDATRMLLHQDAILNDNPLFRDPAPHSSQTFETTALAIKGRQEGTYYGSVKWGWETDTSGTLSQIPLSVVAAGVPSATFMRAAELWNAAKTSTGEATIDLPTSKLPSSAKLPSSRTTAGLVIELARLNNELASMSSGTDKTNKEFEKAALEFELAKRPNKPSISLADQEKAAAPLSTPDLIKRATALPEEIWKLRGEPWVDTTTDKELEEEAVNREIRKRKLFVTVHVHETEDVFSDNVYVTAPSGAAKWSSSVVKLNNGDEHTFVAPLSSVFPGPSVDPTSSALLINAYDEDVEGDDLMFTKTWPWSDLPAAEKQSRDGGTYTVRIDFAQP